MVIVGLLTSITLYTLVASSLYLAMMGVAIPIWFKCVLIVCTAFVCAMAGLVVERILSK